MECGTEKGEHTVKSLPFAGIILCRFNGYDLSLIVRHPDNWISKVVIILLNCKKVLLFLFCLGNTFLKIRNFLHHPANDN